MRDPLLHLTLLGLVLAGVLAMLNPHERYDADDPRRQVGRNVAVRLEVLTSEHGDGWSRGIALPTGTTKTNDSGRIDGAVAWVWFRPAIAPHPGDHIDGTAKVQADGNHIELLLSGPEGARVRVGPHPVHARWDGIIEHPTHYFGRLLLITASYHDGRLVSPDGAHHCPLDGTPQDPTAERWLIRLTLDKERPGWRCASEAE